MKLILLIIIMLATTIAFLGSFLVLKKLNFIFSEEKLTDWVVAIATVVGIVIAGYIGYKQNEINNNIFKINQRQEKISDLTARKELRATIYEIDDLFSICPDGYGGAFTGASCLLKDKSPQEILEKIQKINKLLNLQYDSPILLSDKKSQQNWYTAIHYFGQYSGESGKITFDLEISNVKETLKDTLNAGYQCINLVRSRLQLNRAATLDLNKELTINEKVVDECGK